MEDLAGKRILFVITKSNWGGAQAYVHTLAVRLAAAGADVAVALGGTGRPGSETGLLAERLARSGIRTLLIPSFAREISPLAEWRALCELRACIQSEHPDVLHLNSSKAGMLGSLAGRLVGVKKIVFTAHGWPHREPRNLLMRAGIWLGSWCTVLLSHVVIAVSVCDRRTAPVFLFRRKVHVIHNGIAYFPLVPRDEARRFLAPGVEALTRLTKWVVIPAELTRNKGIDLAIRAFAGVSTNIDDAALLVIGGGEAHASLAKLADGYGLGKRVFFLGFVPDARRYLLAADIFLLPSRKEGLPLSVLEAGVAGLPAIASRTGGIPEVISDKENGLLVRPGDIDGLADALTQLLTDLEKAHTFGALLQETVRTKFSEEEMLSQTAGLYIA